MKKKSLLLAIAAMSMAAVGVGTVGTFAWYQAVGAALSAQTAGTSTVTTASNVTTTDSFTITTTFKAAPGSVRLTDSSGDTYVWDGTNNLPVSDSGSAMAECTIHVAVAYTGTGSYSAAQLQTMWNNVVDSYQTYEIQLKDATDYTSTTVPANGNAPSAIKTAAGESKKYGLKFAANATTYNTGYVLNGTVTGVNVTYGKAEIKNLTFSNNAAGADLTTKVYVGVWGIDGFEQLSGDTYTAEAKVALLS